MARIRGSESIGVEDLDKLARQFKELGGDAQKRLKQTNKKAATFNADDARAAATAAGSTLAHVAPSIKASAGAQFAAVAGGGSSQPAFAGAEFGSNKYKQFKPWLGSGDGAGYAVWPSIRKNLPKTEETYVEDMNKLIKEVGL
jgi:hypothetical protein